MTFRLPFVFLALALVLEPHCAKAEEVEVTDGDEVAKPSGEVEVTDGDEVAKPNGEAAEASAEKGEPSTEDAQQYLDSAAELKEKLDQLKELIAARGEGGDSDLNNKLAGLSQSLESLGLDSLTAHRPGSNRELTEFLSGCLSLSVKKIGLHRSSTIGALKGVAEGRMQQADAAKTDLWKLIGSCVSDLTEQELGQYKRGSMKAMPKALVEAAAKEDAESKVLEFDDMVWTELKALAAGLVKDLGGDNKEKPPMAIGALAGIPLLIVFGVLGKKFMDMQNKPDGRDRKNSGDKKKRA